MRFEDFRGTEYEEAVTERAAIIQEGCNVSAEESERRAAAMYTLKYGLIEQGELITGGTDE